MSVLRVMIVADDPLARAGLSMPLSEHPDCEVIGPVSGASLLSEDLFAFDPDVILWDLGWDPSDTRDLDRLLSFADDMTPIVVLLPDDTLAANVLAKGVQGLLLREVDVDRLVASLKAAELALITLDPELSGSLIPAETPLTPTPLEDLTPREQEVLGLLAEGLSNRAIGQVLDISEHTVKFHVTAIMNKLDAQSRTDAVVRATRLGLILL